MDQRNRDIELQMEEKYEMQAKEYQKEIERMDAKYEKQAKKHKKEVERLDAKYAATKKDYDSKFESLNEQSKRLNTQLDLLLKSNIMGLQNPTVDNANDLTFQNEAIESSEDFIQKPQSRSPRNHESNEVSDTSSPDVFEKLGGAKKAKAPKTKKKSKTKLEQKKKNYPKSRRRSAIPSAKPTKKAIPKSPFKTKKLSTHVPVLKISGVPPSCAESVNDVNDKEDLSSQATEEGEISLKITKESQ